MAEQKEIIINANINTGNTAKDIKDVDKAIVDTTKSVTDLSAKFEDVYGELQPLSSRLGEIEDRMYELALAGKQNTKEFKDLEKEVVKYRKTIVSVDAAVDALSQRGGNMQAALQLGEGVAQGYQGFLSVTTLLGQENEQLLEVMTKLQATQGLIGSFQAIQNAVNKDSILILKAKTLQTTLLSKAQSLYNTVTAGSIGITKALRLALVATGIGAIVVAVGLLASNWDKVKSSVGKATKTTTDYLNSSSKGAKALKWYLDALVYPITLAIKGYRMLKDAILGTSDASRKVSSEQDKVHKMRIAQIDDERKQQQSILSDLSVKISLLEAEGKSTVELRKKKIALQKTDAESTLAALQSVQVMAGKNSVLGKSYDELIVKAKETVTQVSIAEIQLTKEINDEGKKRNDDAKKNAEEARALQEEARLKQLELNRTIEDLTIANIENANERAIAAMQSQQQRERDELISRYGQNTELLKQLEQKQNSEMMALMVAQDEEFTKAEEEQKLKEIEQAKKLQELENKETVAALQLKLMLIKEEGELMLQAQIEVWNAQRDIELQNKELTESEKALITEKYRKQEEDLKQKAQDKELADEKKVLDAKLFAATSVFNGMLDIQKAFSKNTEAAQRRQFKINQAVNIAEAVMSTYKGATAAYTSMAGIPVVGPVLGGIAAAGAIASGIANVKNIASQKFDSGGSSGSSSSSSGGGTPSFSSGVQGGTDMANLFGQSNTGSEIFAAPSFEKEKIIRVKAEVVETEMTSSQSEISGIEAMATL